MLPRCSTPLVFLVVVFAIACGDDSSGASVTDAGQDGRVRPDVTQSRDVDTVEDVQSDGTPADADDPVDDTPDAVDATSDADVSDSVVPPDVDEEPTTDASDALPDATDDCEPLGIPERWGGTFEGDIESDIPPVGNYVFEGPVNGEISFEIRCINQKLVVFGELDGGATNCALASGCPFTAQLDGIYNPETRHMEGEVLDAEIDYSFVQVYAEGVFEGTVSDDLELTGTWSGEMTGASLSFIEAFTATGEGTFTATPL